MTRVHRFAALGLALAVVLTGCSDDDGGAGGERPAESASATGSSPDALAARYLTDEDPAPVGDAEATLELDSGRTRVVAEILEVRAGPASTTLRWQLRAPDASGSLRGTVLSRRDTDPDTSAVALTPVGTKLRLLPGIYIQGDFDFRSCTCPRHPYQLGPEPVEMSSHYPVLEADVQQVEVHIPQFPPITVPVTRG